MGANIINHILIVLQIVILAFFCYIAFYKIKDMQTKVIILEQTQKEFDDFIDTTREIIEEYSSFFDLLIYDLEAKMQKAEEISQSIERTKCQLSQQLEELTYTTELEKGIKNKNNNQQYRKKHSGIIEMAEKGLSIDEIAKRLNMGKREVSLFINMREKKNNNS
ncbi:MAG TPA: DUF2802 domain-containing protein [Thermoanaerobacterales bacterium]|nr:DUF2802 domain-containing protein [Thermoanaerobacterales bacterium]